MMSCPASVQRARACYYLSPGSSPYSPIPVRRASSVNRNFRPQMQQTSSASSPSVRQSFKSWSKVTSATKDSSISASVSRISSVLNLELPQKVWQRFSPVKLVTSTLERKSPPPPPQEEVKEVKQRVHAIHLREDPYHHITAPKIVIDGENETALQVVEPEQHDFATAITQMNSSVTDYLYETKKSPDNAHKPFSKPPSAIRKEMQQPLSQKLANLIPSSLYRKTPKTVENTLPNAAKLCKRTIDQHTKGLVMAVRKAKTNQSRLHRLEELCKHLEAYPDAKNLAVREKVLGALLKLREEPDAAISRQASEALTLVGWTDQVHGPGIRVLSLDGGGTRGLVCIEILKRIEATTGQPIHKQFDLICGVSTGALLGLMLGVFRLPLSDAESIYKDFSRDMFNRHFVAGASGVLTSHSYYDTELWENILKENVGWKSFFETAQDPDTCKIACVSALVNLEKIQNFLFRNYTYPVGMASSYPGSMRKALWQAVRASSAAPGYYEEYRLGKYIHQDGGVLTNNPSAIALHECRLLWPGEQIHCLVSMGNGRYEPTGEKMKPVSVGIKKKINSFVESATDTEAVHTVLNDLLPADSYFRFNPFMSEDFTLDEIREERWEQMQHEARMYCRKNQYKIDKLAERLSMPRSTQQKAGDWMKTKRITMDS